MVDPVHAASMIGAKTSPDAGCRHLPVLKFLMTSKMPSRGLTDGVGASRALTEAVCVLAAVTAVAAFAPVAVRARPAPAVMSATADHGRPTPGLGRLHCIVNLSSNQFNWCNLFAQVW